MEDDDMVHREFNAARFEELIKDQNKTIEAFESETGIRVRRLRTCENSINSKSMYKGWAYLNVTPSKYYEPFDEFKLNYSRTHNP